MPVQEDDSPEVKELFELNARNREMVNSGRGRTELEMSKGETITLVGFMAAGLASLGWAIWASVKEDRRLDEKARAAAAERKRRQDELDNWVNTQEAEGNNVYQLKDGRYLSVARDAKQVVQIKRT
jgi:hypothetical protein